MLARLNQQSTRVYMALPKLLLVLLVCLSSVSGCGMKKMLAIKFKEDSPEEVRQNTSLVFVNLRKLPPEIFVNLSNQPLKVRSHMGSQGMGLEQRLDYNSYSQVLSFQGVMTKGEKGILISLSKNTAYIAAINELYEESWKENWKYYEAYRVLEARNSINIDYKRDVANETDKGDKTDDNQKNGRLVRVDIESHIDCEWGDIDGKIEVINNNDNDNAGCGDNSVNNDDGDKKVIVNLYRSEGCEGENGLPTGGLLLKEGSLACWDPMDKDSKRFLRTSKCECDSKCVFRTRKCKSGPDGKDTKATPILSFVHLSDVQMHDQRINMFEGSLRKFIRLLDRKQESFEHDPYMGLYDDSYYVTLINTINKMHQALPENRKPKFMIHTGDALEKGFVNELYEFIYITNHLDIPWFDVLGNHDYAVYGNFEAKHVAPIHPNMRFLPVATRYNNIKMRDKGHEEDCHVYFSPSNAPHGKTEEEFGSRCNGFDLKREVKFDWKNRKSELGSKVKIEKGDFVNVGYYHFEAVPPEGGAPGVLCIVLDTTVGIGLKTLGKGSLYRYVGDRTPIDEDLHRQKKWLEGALSYYRSKNEDYVVLVFGHHPLNGKGFFDGTHNELIDILGRPENNVIAYFCGHTHQHEINYHKNRKNPKGFGFWEIVTDAILEYPKMGSLVTVKYDRENGKGELVIQGFWPYFLEKKVKVEIEDKCRFGPDSDSVNFDADECKSNIKKGIQSGNVTTLKNARKCLLGSLDDSRAGKELIEDFDELNIDQYNVRLKFIYPND